MLPKGRHKNIMGYGEVLKLLEKQLENINNELEYINKERNCALKTKDIAKELNLNIRSVSQVIKRMKKNREIEVLKGIMNASERYYILSKEYLNKKKWK